MSNLDKVNNNAAKRIIDHQNKMKRMLSNPAIEAFERNQAMINSISSTWVVSNNIMYSQLSSNAQNMFNFSHDIFNQIPDISQFNNLNTNQMLRSAIDSLFTTSKYFESFNNFGINTSNINNILPKTMVDGFFNFLSITDSIGNRFQSKELEFDDSKIESIVNSFDEIIDITEESGNISLNDSNVLRNTLAKACTSDNIEMLIKYFFEIIIPILFSIYLSTSTGIAFEKFYQEEVKQTEISQESLDEIKANRKTNEEILKHLKSIDEKLGDGE